MKYVSWAELHRDVAEFADRHRDIQGVIGVPRSGTMVANLIGLHLNVPVTDIDTFARERLRAGGFWAAGGRSHRPRVTAGKVLLVDDSANTGGSLEVACSLLGGNACGPFRCGEFRIVPAVMYAARGVARRMEHLRVVDTPRVFAWNWNHHGLLKHALLDIDGIVCHDPKCPEDDEDGYVKAISNARPLYIPSWPVHGFVTHRLEKRRDITKGWLESRGVQWGSITMRPEASCYARRSKGDQDGTWKGGIYKADKGAVWFVESSERQARRIAEVSGKPVLCPAADKMF